MKLFTGGTKIVWKMVREVYEELKNTYVCKQREG